MKCSGTLAPILTKIYEAVLRLDHYPLAWKRWTTIVLKKPGKPRYDLAKAWRPIALLNTMGKVLTALVTEDMVEMCEKHNLLPSHHFGGRPGRTTSDALHTLTTKIKKAWSEGKVASALFLDIEAAFPNAVTDQLLTNLRKRRIPPEFINFVRNLLTDRQTTMVFDDYKSDWIDVDNGIGQGDPISMILYLFYNADLVDVPADDKGEAAIAYVDDVTFIVEAKTLRGAHRKLSDMMTRCGGGYEWSATHNSRFESSKLRIMNFTPNDTEHPTLLLQGQEVTRESSYKILGIIIDEHLRWKEQTAAALSKTVQWINAFKRLGRVGGGISSRLLRQLYLAVAIPKLTYALDVWYTPVRLPAGRKRRVGSVRTLKILTKAQRVAALAISGAMRTTANDVLDLHASLPPLEYTLDFICHRNAARAATLPGTHPVGEILSWTHSYQGGHVSPIIALMRLYDLKPAETEVIQATSHRRLGSACPIPTHIAASRDNSKEREATSTADYKIYVDGSGYKGGAGAAAVVRQGEGEVTATSHTLGPLTHYTTFDAEAVGLLLASNEVLTRNLQGEIEIYMDNQSVIQRLESGKKGTGQYILEQVENMLKLAKERAAEAAAPLHISLHWISAHDNVIGNDRADVLAKEAATGTAQPAEHCPSLFTNYPMLPASRAAIRRVARMRIPIRWEKAWRKSARKPKLDRIDPTLKVGKYLGVVGDWRKNRTSVITQLRTGHVPLNQHLHRIKKADSPYCPHCNDKEESVRHYLIECPAYDTERAAMQTECKNFDLPMKVLLATAGGMEATIAFVRRTRRFNNPFGSLEGELLAPRRAAVLREKRERQKEREGRRKERQKEKGREGAERRR
ncbi:hypothetical protein CCMSSC00406_0000129 [Pleurotus cornucopiae]|uniref:Uncharacterized protein n=1 Tax=Pleurotus cornucopiae TaxID=5321 RepID=A0ACB7IY26_PLECO|nr:hypothetical protein CCMSSC00406_0000129 [Pleurotus cornucopiae]